MGIKSQVAQFNYYLLLTALGHCCVLMSYYHYRPRLISWINPSLAVLLEQI